MDLCEHAGYHLAWKCREVRRCTLSLQGPDC